MRENDFWASRRCLLSPIQEIFDAAELLKQACEAHNLDHVAEAADLIVKADMPILAEWTESLWGPENPEIHRYRKIENLPPLLTKDQKLSQRMPVASVRKRLIRRDGYHCRYCGIPVIRQETRNAIKKYIQMLYVGDRVIKINMLLSNVCG